jgi:hypothetical protein
LGALVQLLAAEPVELTVPVGFARSERARDRSSRARCLPAAAYSGSADRRRPARARAGRAGGHCPTRQSSRSCRNAAVVRAHRWDRRAACRGGGRSRSAGRSAPDQGRRGLSCAACRDRSRVRRAPACPPRAARTCAGSPQHLEVQAPCSSARSTRLLIDLDAFERVPLPASSHLQPEA